MEFTFPHHTLLTLMFDDTGELLESEDTSERDPQALEEEAEEGTEDDPPLHYMATAGLSSVPWNEKLGRVELIMPIAEDLSMLEKDEAEALFKFLADLALLCLDGKRHEGLHSFVQVPSIPLFEGMNWVVLHPWDAAGTEVLPGIVPPVTLLTVTPIFQEELEFIQQCESDEWLQAFDEAGIDLDDPYRSSLSSMGSGVTELPTELMRLLSNDSTEPLSSASSFELNQMIMKLNQAMTQEISDYMQAMGEALPLSSPPASGPQSPISPGNNPRLQPDSGSESAPPVSPSSQGSSKQEK